MCIDLFIDSRYWEVFRVEDKVRAVSGKEYEIEGRIACGGNGVVYQCVETISGDEFAIKFQLTLSSKQKRRFEREIDLLKQVRHEQIISYVDHGKVGACSKHKSSNVTSYLPFVVMPLAESNLKEVLKSSRPLLYEDYLGQFKGLARALSELHKRAIHRDIKPENILIKGETWMLSDFGLCRFNSDRADLTHDDEAIGPRYWMSPEAINKAIGNADLISKSSDVFQLCSIFWFVVTGRHPCGSLCKQDWTGPDNLFNLLYSALSHDERKRPEDGEKLAQLLDDATLPPITQAVAREGG